MSCVSLPRHINLDVTALGDSSGLLPLCKFRLRPRLVHSAQLSDDPASGRQIEGMKSDQQAKVLRDRSRSFEGLGGQMRHRVGATGGTPRTKTLLEDRIGILEPCCKQLTLRQTSPFGARPFAVFHNPGNCTYRLITSSRMRLSTVGVSDAAPLFSNATHSLAHTKYPNLILAELKHMPSIPCLP